MSLRRGVTNLWRQCSPLVRGLEVGGSMSHSTTGSAPCLATTATTATTRLRSWEAFYTPHRSMSTKPSEESASAEDQGAQEEKASGHDAELLATLQDMTTEQLHEHILDIKKDLDEKEAHIAEMKDRLVRTLADMENLRDRTSKQLEEARKFATQGLVKSLVEVADNLERAASSVVKDLDAAELDVEKALGLLHGLKDGVVMTDGILMRILEKEGVTRYDPAGESFDPNLHDALFEVPAGGDAKPGTVAVVVKKGYLMHDRAVRAAEVGVVKSE